MSEKAKEGIDKAKEGAEAAKDKAQGEKARPRGKRQGPGKEQASTGKMRASNKEGSQGTVGRWPDMTLGKKGASIEIPRLFAGGCFWREEGCIGTAMAWAMGSSRPRTEASWPPCAVRT